jgi:hypothetical protein
MKLQYEGELPSHIVQPTHRATIRTYRQWATVDVTEQWHIQLRDGSDDLVKTETANVSVLFPINEKNKLK